MLPTDNKANLSLSALYPWFICCIGMLFYCYNYFLRVSPSVMQADLMDHLHISAAQFGNLAAFYYYAYTPLQIPIGLIYDRFGARLVLFFASLIALLGLAIFISADNFLTACAGRFLIGFGTAFAYIGVLKLGSLWLAPNRYATIAGLTTAFGMFSAILSDLVLTQFVQSLGYKNALMSSLIVGFIISVIILVFLRSKPKLTVNCVESPKVTFSQLMTSLKIVLKNPQTWLIGLIGCLFYLPASVLLDLWGIHYLKTAYHLSPETAANIISMTFLGWILSGPSIGILSDKIKQRRLPLLVCSVMAAILLCSVFYIPHLSLSALYGLFFFIGVFCGAHPLCFAIAKENNPINISGTSAAVTNTLIMAGGAIFQPVVGKLLDWHANLSANGTIITEYTVSDYTYALAIIPLGLIISIFLTFFIKETHCQAFVEIDVNDDEVKYVQPSNVLHFKPR